MSMPYSAVDNQHFNPLTQAPLGIPIVPSQSGQIRSAPPSLLHFNSLPMMPIRRGQSEIGSLHVSGDYGYTQGIDSGLTGVEGGADDLEERRSPEESQWSEHPDTSFATTSVELPPASTLWEAPIAIPSPPYRESQEVDPFWSSAPVYSGLSAPVTPNFMVPPGSNQTSIWVSSNGGQPDHLPPIPYSDRWLPMTPLKPRRNHQPVQNGIVGYSYVDHGAAHIVQHGGELAHAIGTMPKITRQDSGTRPCVGLGIAGITFEDRSTDIVARDDLSWSPSEGEDEIESEFEMSIGDDSDADFVPSASKKTKATKTAVRAKSGISNKVKRK